MRKSAESPGYDMVTISSQFAEFDQFMEFSVAWDIDFRQIGPGALNATLSQAVGESWSLAIHRALEAIEIGLDKSITVREVARISKVSRRTVGAFGTWGNSPGITTPVLVNCRRKQWPYSCLYNGRLVA